MVLLHLLSKVLNLWVQQAGHVLNIFFLSCTDMDATFMCSGPLSV